MSVSSSSPFVRQRPHSNSLRRAATLGIAGLAASLLPMVPTAALAADQTFTVTATPLVAALEGGTARVVVTVTTSDGQPLTEQVDATLEAEGGTATGGSDFTFNTRELAWGVGSASGTAIRLNVATRQDTEGETSETIDLAVSSENAEVGGSAEVVIAASDFPYLDAGLPVEERVADLMGRLSLEEKIGQMTQAERGGVDAQRGQIRDLALGSLLSGGGSAPTPNTPTAWADMVDAYQSYALATAESVPLIYGVDSVHGHGNLVGATIFPHNIGLGAMRDPDLVEQAGHITAEETRATGAPWNFAPCVCVARDMRWGRSYESFGEDPALVNLNGTAIDGLQGNGTTDLMEPDRVLATAKHFAGDGLTEFGTGEGDYTIDQGIAVTDRETFDYLALSPFLPAINTHNVGSIMPSFSSVDWTEDGVGNPMKLHASEELVTGWLKQQEGFDGFVLTDYNGIDQIDGDASGNSDEDVRLGVNAGSDMFMEPYDFGDFISRVTSLTGSGDISQERIDDAVSRILTKKFELGLFEKPFTDRTHIDEIGSDDHRAVARAAVAKSQVLLKNAGDALPLAKDASIYVAGRSADNMGMQAGGWTVTWQGQPVKDLIPGDTILEGMSEVAPQAEVTYSEDASAPMAGMDVGVVVVGETPYSEGFGDVGGPGWPWDPSDGGVPREPNKQLSLTEQDQGVVDEVCAAIDTCVVLVVSGRPNIVADPEGQIDAMVAAWLPGSEGAGVADVLFGDLPFTGQLSQTWPKSQDQEPINVGDDTYDPAYPFGWGLRTGADEPAVKEVYDALSVGKPTGDLKDGLKDLERALSRGEWDEDGTVSWDDSRLVLRYVGRALVEFESAGAGTYEQRNALASVLRGIAQERVAADSTPPAGWAAALANGEHAVLVGDLATAVDLIKGVAEAR